MCERKRKNKRETCHVSMREREKEIKRENQSTGMPCCHGLSWWLPTPISHREVRGDIVTHGELRVQAEGYSATTAHHHTLSVKDTVSERQKKTKRERRERMCEAAEREYHET